MWFCCVYFSFKVWYVDISQIIYEFLSEQVGALQEALNLLDKLPEQYSHGMIPEILPIQSNPWGDWGPNDEVTPTPEDVITWMEGIKAFQDTCHNLLDY